MSSRRFDLLVFDWDGTLIDSAPTIVACIQSADCRCPTTRARAT
jgi:phosphoglycolate phosphatase